VQILPSTFRPSVERVIRTQALGTASLFAVRPGKTKFASVTLTHKGDWNAAYWQVGEVTYALVAKVTPRARQSCDLDRSIALMTSRIEALNEAHSCCNAKSC
jgi:hypothetical protein